MTNKDEHRQQDTVRDNDRTKASETARLADATCLIHSGPRASEQQGVLNPPVHRASTIIYDTVTDYANRRERFYDGVMYGLYGTPTALALAEAITALEGAAGTVITGSGTAAITTALNAFLRTGDHLLVADTVYGQTRRYCEEVLTGFGIEVSFFAAEEAEALEPLIRPNTRMIFLESPGSLTFEMSDIPRVVEIARRRKVLTAIDNTWATPLLYKPLLQGVDISIQSGTKYLSGHSDVMLGSIAAACRPHFERLKENAGLNGHMAGPDDCYLVHRGLRTLAVRLKRHEENARRLMAWFAAQPEVAAILSPAWEGDAGYPLWQRDFLGASGLFSVAFQPAQGEKINAMVEALTLFQIGSSWGGYESLVAPAQPLPARSFPTERLSRPLVRVHAGLEEAEDLIADLERAFSLFRSASGRAA